MPLIRGGGTCSWFRRATAVLAVVLQSPPLAGVEPGDAVLGSPSQAAVDAAIAAPLIDYDRDYSGGAHTWGAFHGGASIALAVASHAGNTSADARLLEQIRHILTPGREPTANGGYPAQHERHVTGMFVIGKNTPRIWDQLSGAEKARIDLIMKATLVASAFTTSDNNPLISSGSQQRALDGDGNLNRGWNPNYREGMVGGVLAGMAYFGGPAATATLLGGYDHAAFVAELDAANLPNLHETFNWKADHPASDAPTAAMIETGVRTYRHHGLALADYMGIYDRLVNDTYGREVNAGLNGGAGINGAGRIVSGSANLPNPGMPGMLKEFNSVDAGGARSSLHYAYDGYRPHTTNQICLIVSGHWPKGTASANAAVALQNIGNTDMWYKAEMGYIGYAKGKSQGEMSAANSGGTYGFVYNRSLWDDVLKPYHGLGGGDPAAEFPAGARVITTAATVLHAEATATSASEATLATSTPGTVLSGPVEVGGDEWWQVQFDTGLTGWVVRGSFEPAPASESLVATAGGPWQNRPLEESTGVFTLSFNVRPTSAPIDSVVGLSAGPASGYGELAAIVRLAPDGRFDARNGGSYEATNILNYLAGVTYRVTLEVDVGNRRYRATVTPPDSTPVVIADDFAFRSEQSAVTSLANLAVVAESGSQTVSGVVLGDGGAGASLAPTLDRVTGGMRITYQTAPGRIYQLQASEALADWDDLGDPLSTVGDPGPGLFDFTDPTIESSRYYRIEISEP